MIAYNTSNMWKELLVEESNTLVDLVLPGDSFYKISESSCEISDNIS